MTYDMGGAARHSEESGDAFFNHEGVHLENSRSYIGEFSVSIIEREARAAARHKNYYNSIKIRGGARKSEKSEKLSIDRLRRIFLDNHKRRLKPAFNTLTIEPAMQIEAAAAPGQVSDYDSKHTLSSLGATQFRQETLPLRGDFSPSVKLTEYWVRGVLAHQPLNVVLAPTQTGSSNPEIRAEFSKLLKSSLGMFAQQRRYSGVREQLLAKDGRFITYVQTEICEGFQIVPDEAAEFLRLLFNELMAFSEEGVGFHGAWGCISIVETSVLSLKLSPPHIMHDDAFEQSEDVE